jgi:transcriptional regulator with XRE-family HTH domain
MADDIKTRVSAAVRAARAKKDISQAELAERVGLSMEAISHIERGTSTPSLETFAALAYVLGLDVARLIGPSGRRRTVSRDRARLEAEVLTFAEGLTDREIERWLEHGRVLKKK